MYIRRVRFQVGIEEEKREKAIHMLLNLFVFQSEVHSVCSRRGSRRVICFGRWGKEGVGAIGALGGFGILHLFWTYASANIYL